jgi:tRNA(fMet)-specific endonuclease VapC
VANMEAVNLVLDTDVVIDYLRRRSLLLAQATLRFSCAITAVTFYELLAVPTLSTRQKQVLQEVRHALPILPLDEQAAAKSATVWRDLQTAGNSIGLPDTLIAGTCLAYNLPLLTLNQRHYQRIPQLLLIPPEELR